MMCLGLCWRVEFASNYSECLLGSVQFANIMDVSNKLIKILKLRFPRTIVTQLS